jgi:hypothetical protein
MMNQMKIIVIGIIFASAGAQAGGSGGGGVMSVSPEAETASGAKVRFVGEDRGELVFDYKSKIKNAQTIKAERYKLRAEEFKNEDAKVLKALELSRSTNSWIEIH